MSGFVKKLIRFETSQFAEIESRCQKLKITPTAYIRKIVSDHLAGNSEAFEHLEHAVQDAQDIANNSLEMSAAALGLLLIIHDDKALTAEQATVQTRKYLDAAFKMIPSIIRRKNEN